MATSEIGELQVLITAQADKFNAEIAKVQNQIQAMSASTGKLSAKTIALGGILGTVATKAFGKLVGVIRESDMAYRGASQSLTKLATIMQQRGATQAQYDEIVKLTEAEEKLGVISNDAMQNGLQELATYVGKAESLKKLTNVMNNLVVQQHGYEASSYNVLQTATMMGKVLQGQTGGMERIGYHLTEDEKALFNFGTEEERVALLTDIVNNNLGDLNHRLGETNVGRQIQLANTWNQLKAQVGELASAVGNILIPVFSAVANVVGRAIAYIKAFLGLFGIKTANAASQTASNVSDAADAVGDYGDAATGAAKKVKKSLAAFDEMNVLMEDTSSGSGGGGEGGAGLDILEDLEASALQIDWGSLIPDVELPEWLKSLGSLFSDIDVEAIRAAFVRLWQDIQAGAQPVMQVLSDLWNNYLKPLVTWTGNELLPAFLNALGGAVQFVGQAIGSVWEVALKPFIDAFLVPIAQWTGGTIVNVLNAIGDGLRDIAKNKKLMDTIAKGLTAVGSALAVAKVVKFFNAFADGIAIFKTVKTATGSIVEALSGVASNTTGLTQVLSNLGGNIAQTVSNGLNLLKTGFTSLWGVIKAHPIAAIVTALTALLLTNEDFRASLGNLLNAVITPLMGVLGTIGGVIGEIMSVLGDLLNAIVKPIASALNVVAEVLAVVVNAVAGFISLGLEMVLQPILVVLEMIKPVLEFISGLVQALLSPLEALFGWLGNLFGVTNDNATATDSLNAKLDEEHQRLDTNRDGVISYTEALDAMADAQLAASDATLARIRAEEHLADVTEKYQATIDDLKNKTNLTSAEQKLLEKAEAEVENATIRLQVAQKKEAEEKKNNTDRTREAINAAIENKKSIVATELANNLASDSYENLGDALKAAIDKNDQWTDSLGNTHKFTQNEINQLVTKVLASADEIKNNVTYSMDRMSGQVTKTLTSLTGSSYNNGYNFDNGLSRGIDDNAYLVTNAANRLGAEALAAFKRKLGIQSPSKVMAEQGGFMVKGLAEGIEDEESLAVNSVESLGERITDAFEPFADYSLDMPNIGSSLKLSEQRTELLEARDQTIVLSLAIDGEDIPISAKRIADTLNSASYLNNRCVLNI